MIGDAVQTKSNSTKERNPFLRSFTRKKLGTLQTSEVGSVNKEKEVCLGFSPGTIKDENGMELNLGGSTPNTPILMRCKSSVHSRVSALSDDCKKPLVSSRSLPSFPEDCIPASPSSPRKPSYNTSLSTEEARKRLISWKKNSVYRRKSELL